MYNDRTAQKADTLTLKIILSVDSSVCVEKKHEKALATTTKTKTTCKINSKQNRDYFMLFVLRNVAEDFMRLELTKLTIMQLKKF